MKTYCLFVFLIFNVFGFSDFLFAQSAASTDKSNSRTVEDGGTGPHKALMLTEQTLPTHTVFRPKDMSLFGQKNKLPIIAWGNGACANSPWEHVNFLSEVSSYGFLVIAIGHGA